MEELLGVSNQDNLSVENIPELKPTRLKDIRRYDKKTMLCPSGCGIELELSAIPRHDCVEDLKKRLEYQRALVKEKEKSRMEQAEKADEISSEMEKLALERSRRDEIFQSKETFYQEQISALKEQVNRLEKKTRKLSNQLEGEENETEDLSERDWKMEYDRIVAEKKTMEILFQRREKDYQKEILNLKDEVTQLKDTVNFEKQMVALEYDEVAFKKLESLTKQLQSLIVQRHEQEAVYKNKERDYIKQIDLLKDCVKKQEGNQATLGMRKRALNSLGSLNSDEADELPETE